MTISFYHRKASGLYSIERVFHTVETGMISGVTVRNLYCSYRRGIWGCLYNMLEARLRQSDINHITGDVHYLALALDPKRTVLTIHDCGILGRLRGWRQTLVRLLWFEWPTRRSGLVTVISETTKQELLRVTSCPAARIVVIPNPLPLDFKPSVKPFNPDEPRLLHIGTSEHKNLDRVAAALNGIRCHLTIVGPLSEKQEVSLRVNRINFTVVNDLSDVELLETYNGSDIVLFCSTYEGFGMPVIEANGIGRPVVTSDIEPLRTIAGGAACLIDPYDSNSIRAGVTRVINDADYRAHLIERGFANVARFDARVIAKKYLDAYCRLLPADRVARADFFAA